MPAGTFLTSKQMDAPVKQHTVPKFYLESFVSPEHYPNLLEYDLVKGRVTLQAPKVISVEPNFYSIERNGGKEDSTPEQFLSKLETLYAPTVKRLARFNPSPDDLEDICFMAAFMYVRTRKKRELVSQMTNGFVKSLLLERADRFDQMTEEERDELPLTPEEHRRAAEEYSFKPSKAGHIEQMMEAIPKITDELRKMPIEILLARPPSFFITSDDPVSVTSTDARKRVIRISAAEKTLRVTFPVSPLVCILWKGKGMGNAYVTSARLAREINIRTAQGAFEAFYSPYRTEWLDALHTTLLGRRGNITARR